MVSAGGHAAVCFPFSPVLSQHHTALHASAFLPSSLYSDIPIIHPESPKGTPTDPSPSALFARRLMHFCSAEVASASAHLPPTASPTSISFCDPPLPPFSSAYTPWHPP